MAHTGATATSSLASVKLSPPCNHYWSRKREKMQSTEPIRRALLPRKFTQADVDDAVADAKRDLAEKVLAAISGLRIDDRFSPHWQNGFGQCKGDALRELQRVFTESGVEVKRSADADIS